MWIKGCVEAVKLLDDHGWRLDQKGYWTKPASDYRPSPIEWDALDYLCEWWDYGFRLRVSS